MTKQTKQVDIASIVNEQNSPEPEYDILVVNNISLVNAIKTLAKEVNKKCQEGWKREGDIIISPIKTTEYTVLQSIAKRSGTGKVPQYDIVVECANSASKAIGMLAKDLDVRCQEGWRREGEVGISPIRETTNKVVVYHIVTK